MSYWSNPLKYQCIPPPPGEIDELKLLGGQEIVINHSTRSHSSSPSPLTSQVSHVRTQHLHCTLSHDHSPQATVQGYIATPYSDPSSSSSSSMQSYPSFNNSPSLDTFNFDMDESFLSSNVPSYEQIMQAATSTPYSSVRAQTFPPAPPDHGFHPAGYHNSQERFDQGAYPPRSQTMDSLASGPTFDGCGHKESVWGTFVGDLVSGANSSQYPSYGM